MKGIRKELEEYDRLKEDERQANGVHSRTPTVENEHVWVALGEAVEQSKEALCSRVEQMEKRIENLEGGLVKVRNHIESRSPVLDSLITINGLLKDTGGLEALLAKRRV